MADINGKRITSTAATPNVYYDITYTKSRPNNSQMRYVFTIKTILENKYSWIGTGHNLTATITVNGSSGSAVIKTRDESWQEAPEGTVRSTDTITITCGSTSTAVQTVTFKVVNTYGSAGVVTNSSYTVAPIAPAPSYTKCGKPSWKTSSGTTFYGNLSGGNGNVTVSWNAGSAGTNNSVTGYIIEAQYPNGDWYEKWNGGNVTSATINFDGYADRNCDINLRIRTKGSAGASYYSDWSSTIYVRSLGRTKCEAPGTVTIRSGTSATSSAITQKDCGSGSFYIHWTAGSAGVNNSISGYIVYKRNKTSGQTTWSVLREVSASTLYTSDSSSESNDYEYCVVTKGSAGSSWNSGYSSSKMIRMRVTSPTKLEIAVRTVSGQTDAATLENITHPLYGAVKMASWSPNPSKKLYLNLTPSGGVGVKSYRIYRGLYSAGQDPTTHSSPSSGWVSVTSTSQPGSAYPTDCDRLNPSQSIVYRVDAIGNNGLTSSSFAYSIPLIGSGTIKFKVSSNWDKISVPLLKVSGTWRTPVQVWQKVSGTWKKSF